MRKLVIDREKWLRGQGAELSKLLRREDEKMCCVGFYLESCGVPRETLLGNAAAHSPEVALILPDEAKWLNNGDLYLPNSSPIGRELYAINDRIIILNSLTPTMDELERENRVMELFSQQGVEVEFIN